MKVTKKLSPILLAVVAVVVGCSMIGAATTVLVTSATAPTTTTATVAAGSYPVTLAASAVGTDEASYNVAEMPLASDGTLNTVTPDIGTVYATDITMTVSDDDLQNLVFYLMIQNTATISSSDVSVNVYSTAFGTGNWYPVTFESYGNYVLADIPITPLQSLKDCLVYRHHLAKERQYLRHLPRNGHLL